MCRKKQLSRPISCRTWRAASRKGSDSMSPTVPPISVMTTSTRLRALAAGHDPRLDLVGDVRDDLHRVAQVLAAPLPGDHARVDLPGRDVGPAGEVDVEEALVVTDVQVGLGAVLGDEDLTVLERVHRPGIDVEVGVQLLHRDPQATAGQQGTQRTRCQSLAERGHNAAGDEDELRRLGVVKEARDHVFQTVDPRETTVTRPAPSAGSGRGDRPSVSPEPVPAPRVPAASHTSSGTSSAAAVAGSATPESLTAAPTARLSRPASSAARSTSTSAAGSPAGPAPGPAPARAQQAARAEQPEGRHRGDRQHPGQRAAQQDVQVGLRLPADHRPRLAGQHLLDEPAEVGALLRRAAPVEDGDRGHGEHRGGQDGAEPDDGDADAASAAWPAAGSRAGPRGRRRSRDRGPERR